MFDGHYHDWNYKRIKLVIDHYGYSFFHGKTILDLGGGHGDLGASLYRLGAQVTVVDARAEHLKVAAKKYPGIKIQLCDLDKDWPFGKYDIILNLDLICHLKNFENHLRNACNSTDHIIVETAVCDSNDDHLAVIMPENRDVYDASFNGFSARPTGTFIERIFKECGMEYKRFDQTRLGVGKKSYDWRVNGTNACDENKRRFWMAKRTKEIQQQASLALVSNVAQSLVPGQPLVIPPPPIYTPPPNPFQPLPPPPPVYAVPQVETKQPTTPSRIPFAPPTKIISTKPTKEKMRLFYNYYRDTDPKRKEEIDYCLDRNMDNNLFDLVIIESEKRPTFNYLFEKINQLVGPNDISIISNADIFFDHTLGLTNRLNSKEIYALSRYDWHKNGSMIFFDKENAQDTWIMRGPVLNVNGNFPIGLPGSDAKIAHEFTVAGYKVLNPGKSINSMHYHDSNIKNYTEADRVLGPYLNVEPKVL